jgi:hypothetical protein
MRAIGTLGGIGACLWLCACGGGGAPAGVDPGPNAPPTVV